MLLCCDVGNSRISIGVFLGDVLAARCDFPSHAIDSASTFITQLKSSSIQPGDIKAIAYGSVVPAFNPVLEALAQHLSLETFVLSSATQSLINIHYDAPETLGADRIASAIAACHFYPNEDRIIVDMGTATTFSAVSHDAVFLGGAIAPGSRISIEALTANTAQLPDVAVIALSTVVQSSTAKAIQAGVYFGQVGMIKEVIAHMQQEVFGKARVIATGGFAPLFTEEHLFDYFHPDLTLHGIRLSYEKAVATTM